MRSGKTDQTVQSDPSLLVAQVFLQVLFCFIFYNEKCVVGTS